MKLICRVGTTVSMVPENRISGSLCGRNKSTMVVLKAAISKNTSKGVKFEKLKLIHLVISRLMFNVQEKKSY